MSVLLHLTLDYLKNKVPFLIISKITFRILLNHFELNRESEKEREREG
jgi:hypothetical protein